MFELLQNFKGSVVVNDITFASIKEAEEHFKDYVGGLRILLKPNNVIKYDNNTETSSTSTSTKQSSDIYRVEVKSYMSRPFEEGFFLAKMNKSPMPYLIMVGSIISQTEKMVKMDLHVDLNYDTSVKCIRCGRVLTNPISQYLHIGPECGASEHMRLLNSGISIDEVRNRLQDSLKDVHWVGWIPKSAIVSAEKIS